MSEDLMKQIAQERERADYAWRNTRAIDAHYMAADKKQRATIERLRDMLARAMEQLDKWHEKYGEHNPEWLPPNGDVQLAEAVSDFLYKEKH